MKKLIGLLLLCLFFFMITFIHVAINRSGRNVSRLQRSVEIKEARNQYLSLEISRLSSPQQVIPYAKEHLGLQEAQPQNIVVLEKDKK